MPEHDISTEEFDNAVRSLAHQDGIVVVLSIPGVWEHVAEFYNNAAIDKINEEREAAEE